MPETEESVAVPDESSENYVYPDEDDAANTPPSDTEAEPPIEGEANDAKVDAAPVETTEETQEEATDAEDADPDASLTPEELRAKYNHLKSEVGRLGNQAGKSRKELEALGYTFDQNGLPTPPANPQTPVATVQPQAPREATPVDAFLAAQPNPDDLDLFFNPNAGKTGEYGYPLDKFGREVFTRHAFTNEDGELDRDEFQDWKDEFRDQTAEYEELARRQHQTLKQQREQMRQQVAAEEQAITSLLTTKVFTAVPEAEREAAVVAHRNEALSLVQRMGGNPSDPYALRVGTALLLLNALEQADLQTSAKPAPVQNPNRPATARLAPQRTPPPVDGGTGSVPAGVGAGSGRKAAADDDAAYKADTFSYDD